MTALVPRPAEEPDREALCICNGWDPKHICPVHAKGSVLAAPPAPGGGDTDLRALADLWDAQQADYPDHEAGAAAAAAVRLCARELRAALAARDANQGGPEWTQDEWVEWSNRLADLMPERYDGDEAQEALIERFVREAAARDANQGAGARRDYGKTLVEGYLASASALYIAGYQEAGEWLEQHAKDTRAEISGEVGSDNAEVLRLARQDPRWRQGVEGKALALAAAQDRAALARATPEAGA